MTITTQASNGVQVNSAAKDSAGSASTLGSQTAALPDEIIVPTAIGTNNEGNLESSPTYVGRLIQIREGDTHVDTVEIDAGGTGYAVNDVIILEAQGVQPRTARLLVTSVNSGVVDGIKIHEAGDAGTPAVTVGFDRGEYSSNTSNPVAQSATTGSGTGAEFNLTFKDADEYRYVTADASNTLTVHEDWVDGPATGENWRISYLLDDAATVTGMSLINKRLSDYSSSRRLQVTSGGWLAFLDGVSLETVDNGSTTVADVVINSSARFDIGYLSGGVPVSGAYIIGTPATSGELVFDQNSASDGLFIYDAFWTHVVDNDIILDGPIQANSFKIFRPRTVLFSDEFSSPPVQTFKGLRVEWDQGNEFEYGNVRHATFEDCIFIGGQCALINRTGTFPLSGRNTTFVNNVIDVYDRFTTATGGQFHANVFVNPNWSVNANTTEQSKIRFAPNFGDLAVLARSVYIEAYELLATILDNTGTPITDATFHVVEEDVENGIVVGTSTDGFPSTTDSNGQFSDDLYAIIYRDNVLSGGASFTDGTNGITLANPSSQSTTVTRLDAGSFITDGFAVGNFLRISFNGGPQDGQGTYEITAVAAGNMTLADPIHLSTVNTADLNMVLTEVDINAEQRGNFAFRAYSYGRVPFLSSIPLLLQNTTVPVTLFDDSNITEATQATAITNGAGIILEKHPTPPNGPYNIQTTLSNSAVGTIDLASYTVPSGLNDACLVVAVGNDTQTVTGIDFGVGVDALTAIVTQDEVTLWRLLNPTAATRDIRVTFSSATSDVRVAAFYLTGVNQSTPIDQTLQLSNMQAPNFGTSLTPTATPSFMLGANYQKLNTNPDRADIRKSKTTGFRTRHEFYDEATPDYDTLIITAKRLYSTAEQPIWLASETAFEDMVICNFETSGDAFAVKVLNYDGGTGGLPTIGETITINNAGADTTGVLHEYIGDAVSGTLVLTGWNGTAPENDVNITGGTSSFDATSHTSGGGSFDEEYTWLVDCDSNAMTVVYDYLMAKMCEAGTNLDTEFFEAIEWGEDEQSQLVYKDTTGYFTERNVNRAEGVWLSNRGAGSINYMTSDGGVQFVPPVTIDVTFTGMKDNTEVRVCDFTTDEALAGVEDAVGGSPDDRSVTFSLTSGTVVNIRFANDQWIVPDRNSILNFTWPATDTTIPITQVLDRNYSNP